MISVAGLVSGLESGATEPQLRAHISLRHPFDCDHHLRSSITENGHMEYVVDIAPKVKELVTRQCSNPRISTAGHTGATK